MREILESYLARFWDFLSGEGKTPPSYLLIFMTSFILVLLFRIWALFVNWVHTGWITDSLLSISSPAKSKIFFDVCVFTPICEEMIFRFFPFLFAMILSRFLDIYSESDNFLSAKIKFQKALYFIFFGLIISVYFGIHHGSFLNIFVQGVFGLVLWIELLYFSRLGKELYLGLLAVILTHAFYNFFELFIF